MPAPAQFPLFMKSSGPFRSMSKLKFFLSLIVCLILSGCVFIPAKAPANSDSNALIAQDMVNVLAQIAQLPAGTTTLSIPTLFSRKDPFTATLAQEFKSAGYAVRTASGGHSGAAQVSYELARYMDPQHGAVSTYTVSVGSISVRRSYITVDDQQVQPLAPMQIKGASAAGLRLDNQLFANQGTPTGKPKGRVVAEAETALPASSSKLSTQSQSTASVLSTPGKVDQPLVIEGNERQESPSSLGQAVEPSLLNIAAPTTYSIAGRGVEPNTLRELSNSPTRNVRELGQSNFADVFARLTIVDEIILTFDNDSVRMGAVNKTRVSNLVSLFNGATDVFSVIGCSNGATNLAMGQQGLALGRAERVREELLFAGVPDENILEEGCWAGEYYDELMPRRGVVLSLKRRPG